jgi:hypothetical protein
MRLFWNFAGNVMVILQSVEHLLVPGMDRSDPKQGLPMVSALDQLPTPVNRSRPGVASNVRGEDKGRFDELLGAIKCFGAGCEQGFSVLAIHLGAAQKAEHRFVKGQLVVPDQDVPAGDEAFAYGRILQAGDQ